MWATAVDHHDLPGLALPFDGRLDAGNDPRHRSDFISDDW
jgi:hypothetical protein